ncbi:MAG: four helix bundle protein [candidate division WOR-3 bacterium]|nr:four helix bundle protein [candidate division WOR-3 bacterium]
MKERTKEFALKVVRLYTSLPKSVIAQTLGKQILRSGTSVGAHYREAVHSRSDAEYISKVEGALQELEESGYWLELLADSGVCKAEAVAALRREADELTAMLVACARKAKAKTRR